jgi:hypothetical protein
VWNPSGSGSATLRARAVDDSGNRGASSAAVTCDLTTGVCANAPPPTSVSAWPDTTVPGSSAGASAPVELGVKFRSDVAGFISGVRFYKAAGNTGTHVGNLWSSAGALLATATFTNETASGWQRVDFSQPVAIVANTTYVASYHCPVGFYSFTGAYFTTQGVDAPPLHLLASNVSGGNGVYAYAATSIFPIGSYNAANYWVDVVFSPGAAATLTSIAVTPTPSTALIGGTQQFTATGTYSDGHTQNLTNQVTWTSSLPAVATVNATGLASALGAGTTTVSATLGAVIGSAPFTVSPPGAPVSAWPDTTVPSSFAGASAPVELGVKFRSDVAGYVTSIRFYKAAGNTGTHVGNLWSSAGALLATATFTNETASGWQRVDFSQPVAIAANTTYVASYHCPVGFYSFAGAYFTIQGVDAPPLHLLASNVSGGNGVFRYTAASAFPTGSYNAANYWVDVVFTP